MEGNSSYQSFIDYFKLFKVFDLKKIEKTGLVKLIQDKILNRKVLSVEGNISTSNFIIFNTNNYPNIAFSERFLYLQGHVDSGKSFCLQITYSLGNKQFKAVYSSLYKAPKKHLENIVHLPLSIVSQKWSIIVIDLYDLGLHFGFKPQQMKLIFRINAIEVRASSKVKGIFQSDYLYSVDKMPKDINYPLKKDQNYFQKYTFSVVSTDQASLKYSNQAKELFHKEILESKKQSNLKNTQKSSEKNKIQKVSKHKSLSRQKTLEHKAKNQEKNQSKQNPTIKQNKKKSSVPLPRDANLRSKQQKNKPKYQEEVHNEDIQPVEIEQEAPKPQGTISMSLSCVQGYSLNQGTITTVQSYILKPNYMPTHKKIKVICQCDQFNVKLITGYIDGSICLWDTVRRQPLSYFMTELNQLRDIKVDQKMSMVIVGLDKMKRQVINVVSNNSVIFRQISTFNISGLQLVNKASFQDGFLTFGYENIRLWKVNNQKSIIQGSSVYLGQTNRKVKYNSALIVKTREDFIAFVVDTNGFITTISILQAKMLQSIKINTCPIDNIVPFKGDQKDQLRAIISDQLGVIKVLNLQRMELLEQLNLNNRIKDLKQLHNTQELILTHYNKSIGVINLESGLYSFLMRSHTARTTNILYNKSMNKVISMSKDCSIRIWLYVSGSQGVLPFHLQQQYEFIITGQQLISGVCGEEGKSQDLKYVVVGSDSGKMRLIDIERFTIKQEILLQAGRMSLGMSRNGRYIVCTYQSGNSYLLDINLNVLSKYPNRCEKKRTKNNWINGFNKLAKQFFLEHLQQNKIEFYSLKEPQRCIFSIQNNNIKSIQALGDHIFVVNNSQLMIYDREAIMQVINFEQSNVSHLANNTIIFSSPIICFVVRDKVIIKVLATSLQQQVQLPEESQNLTLSYNQSTKEGFIFCAGTSSFALYVITFRLHNVSSSYSQISTLTQNINKIQGDQEPNQLQISFSNTQVSGFTSKQAKQVLKKQKVFQPPRQLKKLYAQQQQIYQQVKQYLFPEKYRKQQPQIQQEQTELQNGLFDQPESQGMKVFLEYGYELRQEADSQKQVGFFLWVAENNSLILQTGEKRDILQHFFSVPVKHKLINFPFTISSLSASQKSCQGMKYLVICVNSIIKVYNAYEEVSYIRTIQSLSSAFPTNVIFQSAVTNCNLYIVALSYNNTNFDNKIYIQIIEITSGNIVSSSYLSLPPVKNKYKGAQIKQAKEYKLLLNPFKSSLQFIIYNYQGAFHFYRITSVLTLQTIQLQEMLSLSKDKMGQLTAACFINIGEENYEDTVIAVGSVNGSITFVDTRTANILIACIGLIPNSSITSLSFSRSSSQQQGKMIVFTNSTNVYVFQLFNGINTILASMQPKKAETKEIHEETKKWMILDGEVTSRSNISNQNQQLVITKCGSLWLLDYADFVTVKISSIHTNIINQAEILASEKGESCLITCANDGCVKVTNLANMEQILQIYKPRKQAKTFNLQGQFTLIAFGQEVFIYNKLQPQNMSNNLQLTTFGSFKLQSIVLSIKNIPSTNNYYVLTENELLIIYVTPKLQKDKIQTVKSLSSLSQQLSFVQRKYEVQVQIQKITDLQNPLSLVVNEQFAPYDQFGLLYRAGKSTVWARKCFKKNYNPIQQLTNVHQLSYYLIDATNRNTVDHSYLKFLSQNEYLWGLYQESLIQIRNFRQHVVTREITLSIDGLTSMMCLNNDQLYFMLGDSSGNFYLVNQNGLLIQRKKVLQNSIKGLSFWNSARNKKVVAYGSRYAAIITNLGIK